MDTDDNILKRTDEGIAKYTVYNVPYKVDIQDEGFYNILCTAG